MVIFRNILNNFYKRKMVLYKYLDNVSPEFLKIVIVLNFHVISVGACFF